MIQASAAPVTHAEELEPLVNSSFGSKLIEPSINLSNQSDGNAATIRRSSRIRMSRKFFSVPSASNRSKNGKCCVFIQTFIFSVCCALLLWNLCRVLIYNIIHRYVLLEGDLT